MEITQKIEGLDYTFKEVSVRSRVKFMAFMAQVAGGNLIYDIIAKGGLDTNVDADSINKLIGNITDENIDKLVDRWLRPQIIVPKAADDNSLWEQFENKIGMQGFTALVVFFVSMMITGKAEDVDEIKKKLTASGQDTK
jgi:hypothetical protein